MKVTIAPQVLLDGLMVATGAAATRTPKVALQGVLITAQDNEVLLMATNLEAGIRYKLTQVEVEKDGQALVPASKLTQIIRECSDETILLETKGNLLHIWGSDSHFQVYSSDIHEFPPVPELEGEADFELKAEHLRLIIERTLFAAAKESTRYAIDGLLWEKKGQTLKVVSTDGRRLALISCAVMNNKSQDNSVIVPSKTMSLIQRVIVDPEEVFQIRFLSNQILFKSSRVTISSVLVEGHFPKYEDVIPKDNDKIIKVNVPNLLSAVRRASLLTSEDSKAIRISFSENQATMMGRAPEQGEASVSIKLPYDSEPMEIGFNPGYLMDVLKVLDTDEVQFELKDSNRPGVFRNQDDYLYVIMPVNLS